MYIYTVVIKSSSGYEIENFVSVIKSKKAMLTRLGEVYSNAEFTILECKKIEYVTDIPTDYSNAYIFE